MAEYSVKWEIDVEGDDVEGAAKAARNIARNGTWSSVYDVRDTAGKVTRVDLDEGTQEPAPQTAERRMIDRIAARLRGEWFDPTGDLESDIAGVLRGDPEPCPMSGNPKHETCPLCGNARGAGCGRPA